MDLFKLLPIAAVQTTANGTIIKGNDRAQTLFGQSTQITGKNINEFVIEQDIAEFTTFSENIQNGRELCLKISLCQPENRQSAEVLIRGSVIDAENRIFTLERCDPYGPGCSKMCKYATLLEAQFQNNPGGILLVNEKMEMLSFNREFIKIWDISEEIQQSRDDEASIRSILDKVVEPEVFIAKINALYNKPDEICTDEILLKDGRVLYRHSYPIYNEKTYLGRVWHFLDLTQLKNANYKIENQQIFQNAILDNIRDGVIACDTTGKINLFNRAGQNLFGYSSPEEIPDSYAELKMFSQDGSAITVESSPLSIALEGNSVKNVEITTRAITGLKQSLRVNGQPMYDSESNKLGAVISLHNFTDLKKARKQLQFMAYHDALTGLPNRRLFHDLLEQSFKQAHRNNMQVGVLFLDLDNFKGVNDVHGHAVGDQVLVEVASCLQQRLRESDIICRWGGDEFVVGLLDSTGKSGIMRVAEQLGNSVEKSVHQTDESKNVSISIGVSIFPDHGSLPDRLIRNADVAMYRAKRKGKNRCELFDL